MRLLAVSLLAASMLALCANAAVIQGVVLDDETGNPLARTIVNLVPLPGTQAGTVTIRAAERGSFVFTDVHPGWYILRCSRRGFLNAEVGQLRPGRPGMPFEIAPDSQSSFFQVRMKRLGALTGAVLDENSVGIPEWPVHLYTAQRPVKHVAETKTDDRGFYRFGELDSGSYIVRSGPFPLDDGTWLLPTYFKYGIALENAETARVRVGETQPDIVIRPVPGKMIELGGQFSSQVPATLTLITDTGRRIVASSSGGAMNFNELVPPGPVELVAAGTGGICGAYTRLIADHDTQGIRMGCGPLQPPQVTWLIDKGRNLYDPRQQFPLLMRRVDLDGTGPVRTLKSREPIVPGHWELRAQVSSDYYVQSISTTYSSRAETKNDGWFAVDLGPNNNNIYVSLNTRPASVSGIVTTGGKPVAGAAVYLELFDPMLPTPRIALFEGRSDAQGNYKFGGLAPAHYRVLSSFDFDPEDRFVMERAAVLTLREADNASQALELILP